MSNTNSIDGTITVPSGYTFTIGNVASLPNATLEAEGPVAFNAGSAGSFMRLRNLLLRNATLTLGTPSAGDVEHIVSGAILADAHRSGTSQIAGTGSATYATRLSAGTIAQAEGSPCFLNISATALGDTVKVVCDTPPVALDATGTDGTPTTPVIPWIRANGALLRHDATDGLVVLDTATDEVFADAGAVTSIATAGENLAVVAPATVDIADASGDFNALSSRYSGTDKGAFYATNGLYRLLSGAIDFTSYNGDEFRANLDLGSNRGYFTGMISTAKNATGNMRLALAGTGGVSFSDYQLTPTGRPWQLFDLGSTYSGDTYLYCTVNPKSTTLFPHGVERPGDMYVYGTLNLISCDGLIINGLNGNGSVASSGSGTSRLIVGADGSDGEFTGSFVNNPTGANFGFRKIGDGYQRIAADMGFKWTCSVEAGTLQVDGAVMLNRSDNIEVSGSGTLAGCGRFGGYNKVWVKNGGTLAPGSAEMPNEPMVITNSSRAVSIPLQLDEGSALRFHIDRSRASQLLVSGAVTGTSGTVPVAIDGETPPGRTWMLMEAASFAPTFALVPGTSGKLSVKTTATTSQLWYTRAPEHTMLILL